MKDRSADMLKILKFFGLAVLILILAISAVVLVEYSPSPFAIRDPSNPHFKAENFRFQDYPKGCHDSPELRAVLAAMFPKGTDEAYMDEILLKHAGANTRGIENGKKVYGRNGITNLTGWRVTAFFDQNHKTVSLNCGPLLY